MFLLTLQVYPVMPVLLTGRRELTVLPVLLCLYPRKMMFYLRLSSYFSSGCTSCVFSAIPEPADISPGTCLPCQGICGHCPTTGCNPLENAHCFLQQSYRSLSTMLPPLFF